MFMRYHILQLENKSLKHELQQARGPGAVEDSIASPKSKKAETADAAVGTLDYTVPNKDDYDSLLARVKMLENCREDIRRFIDRELAEKEQMAEGIARLKLQLGRQWEPAAAMPAMPSRRGWRGGRMGLSS